MKYFNKKMSKSSEQNHFNNFSHQYYAAFVVNMIMFAHSCYIGWLSPVLPYLKSNETHLESGPLTVQEISWMGSGSSIGAFPGAFIFGWLIYRIGVRKIFVASPFYILLCWIIVIFATSSTQITISRILVGFGGAGLEQSMALYIADIADDRIRGALGSMQLLSRSVGYLAAFIVGAIVDYSIFPLIFIGIPVITFILIIFLPNSPQYLIRNGDIEGAKIALKYYKNCKEETHDEEIAIEKELNRLIEATKQTHQTEAYSLKDFHDPLVIKGLIIAIVLPILNISSGCFTFMTYGVTIFKQSGTHIDPYLSAILLAALLVMGNIFSTMLVESLGRRFLMIISLSGSTIGLFTMAGHMYLDAIGVDVKPYHWVPVVSLGFDVFISAIGIIPLAFVCIVESLPPKMRGLGLIVASFSVYTAAFLATKLFPILTESINLHGSMSIFGIICAFGTIFVIIFVKETSGINLDTIGNDDKKDDVA